MHDTDTVPVLIMDGPYDGQTLHLADLDPGADGDTHFVYRGRKMRRSDLHSGRIGQDVYIDVS